MPSERPDEGGSERGSEKKRQGAHRAARAGGDRETDDTEGEEDDPLGKGIPGAVACDRPPHGQPRPSDEGDSGRSGGEAREIEAGQPDRARATTR